MNFFFFKLIDLSIFFLKFGLVKIWKFKSINFWNTSKILLLLEIHVWLYKNVSYLNIKHGVACYVRRCTVKNVSL